MIEQLTYCQVDGPPADWLGCRVFDVDTGEEIRDVIACNVEEGWVKRYVRDSSGDLVICTAVPVCYDCGEPHSHGRVERIEGRFRIERPGDGAQIRR